MEPMEMGMSVGPMILGLSLDAFLMIASGVFYVICAALLWKPVREEKNELIAALMAFLIYQAVSMIFMGLEIHTMNIIYSNIASLAVFIGSAYMLKFPFSSFSERTRRIVFMISIIIVLALFAWFMQTPGRQMSLMSFILWYDIVVNGLIVGGSIFLFGLMKAKERWLKVKALGGGTGIVSCCVVSNAAMLSGAVIISSVFAFLAPVILMSSLIFARRRQRMEIQGSAPAII